MQIQALEEYFGTKLLHRSTKKLNLSEAGQKLLPYAKRCLDLVRETEEMMSNYTLDLQGRLKLAASLTIGEYALPHLLGAFAKQHPQLDIQLQIMNTSQIVAGVRSQQLHLGLVEAPVTETDIHVEAVMEDELMLITPRDHPLMNAEKVRLEDVMQYPFVLRETGSGTRIVMEEALRAGRPIPPSCGSSWNWAAPARSNRPWRRASASRCSRRLSSATNRRWAWSMCSASSRFASSGSSMRCMLRPVCCRCRQRLYDLFAYPTRKGVVAMTDSQQAIPAPARSEEPRLAAMEGAGGSPVRTGERICTAIRRLPTE